MCVCIYIIYNIKYKKKCNSQTLWRGCLVNLPLTVCLKTCGIMTFFFWTPFPSRSLFKLDRSFYSFLPLFSVRPSRGTNLAIAFKVHGLPWATVYCYVPHFYFCAHRGWLFVPRSKPGTGGAGGHLRLQALWEMIWASSCSQCEGLIVCRGSAAMWCCLTLAHFPQLYLKFATHNMAVFALFSLRLILCRSLDGTFHILKYFKPNTLPKSCFLKQYFFSFWN